MIFFCCALTGETNTSAAAAMTEKTGTMRMMISLSSIKKQWGYVESRFLPSAPNTRLHAELAINLSWCHDQDTGRALKAICNQRDQNG